MLSEQEREELDRVRNLFPDRFVNVRLRPQRYRAATLAWASKNARADGACHADRDCPHFPDGALAAYTMDYVRGSLYLRPCSHCTVEEAPELYVVCTPYGGFVELEDQYGAGSGNSLDHDGFMDVIEPYLDGGKGEEKPVDNNGLRRVRLTDRDARRVAP